MRGKRVLWIAIAAGLVFFAASFLVARSIKETTGAPPAASPDAVVIEQDTILVPGAGAGTVVAVTAAGFGSTIGSR